MQDNNNVETPPFEPIITPDPWNQVPPPPPPIVTEPKKPNKKLVIILSIIILLVLGAIIYMMFFYKPAAPAPVKPANQNQQQTPETEEDSEPTPTDTSDNVKIDEDVKEIMDALRTKALESLSEENVSVEYNVSTKPFSYAAKSIIMIDNRIVTQPSYYHMLKKKNAYTVDYRNLLEPMLTEHNYEFILQQEVSGYRLFHNSEKNIYCTTTSDTVSCAKESWISEEDKSLIVSLADSAELNTLYANADDIEDSPVTPYQRIIAHGNDYSALFYRVSSESGWVYVGGTQTIGAYCSEYNEDAKKAFSGTKCYDETTKTGVEL